MPQRAPMLQAAGALLIVSAILWFETTSKPDPTAPAEGGFFNQSHSVKKIAEVNATAENFPDGAIAVAGSTHAIHPAPFGQILDLLQQTQRLGPGEREREDELRNILLTLLTDENAAVILQALPVEFERTEFGVAALERWASVDPLGAMLWLVQQPTQSPEQTHALAKVLSKNPALLELVCAKLPSSPWREALLGNAARVALSENPRTAVRLAQQMQPSPDRIRALLRIADDWTSRDPAEAARWIANEPNLFLRDELILAASTTLASTDPEEAFAWITAISFPPTFERALTQVASVWTSYASQEAGQFINKIGPPLIPPSDMSTNFSR